MNKLPLMLDKMTITYFFNLDYGKWFRWQKEFWMKVGQNQAVSITDKVNTMVDTATLVGVFKKDLK